MLISVVGLCPDIKYFILLCSKFGYFVVSCRKFGSPYLGKAQQPQEQPYLHFQ